MLAQENVFNGAILRDLNTPVAYSTTPLLNGYAMKSEILTVLLQNDENTLQTLFKVNIASTTSPVTNR